MRRAKPGLDTDLASITFLPFRNFRADFIRAATLTHFHRIKSNLRQLLLK